MIFQGAPAICFHAQPIPHMQKNNIRRASRYCPTITRNTGVNINVAARQTVRCTASEKIAAEAPVMAALLTYMAVMT